MESDTSDGAPLPFDEVDDQMTDDRAAVLAALARTEDDGDGGGLPTGQLREATAIPSGSMRYHMGKLERWDLVEVVGKEREGGGGSPSKVYALTERGREYLSRSGVGTFASAEEVAELRGRVGELEAEVETRQQEIVELVRLLQRELDVDVAAGVGGGK